MKRYKSSAMRKRTTVCLAVLIFILVIVVSMARVAAQTMKESDAEDVARLMKRERFRNGMKADDENLRRVIERGGKDMPGYRNSLKPAQIRDLIAYVKTL